MEPIHPVQVVADRADAPAARGGLRGGDRASSGRSRSASSTRCSRSRVDALKRAERSARQAGVRDADRRDQPATPSSGRSSGPGQGPPLPRTSPRRRWSAASGAKGDEHKYELDDRQQPDRAEDPGRRHAGADRLIASGAPSGRPLAGVLLRVPARTACCESRLRKALRRAQGHRRHLARGRRGRGAGHPRPQRRRQDDAVQPDHRRRARRRGRVAFDGRDITALPPHQRCRAASAARYQVPQPFEQHDGVREPAWSPPASAAAGASAEAWRRRSREVLEQTGLAAQGQPARPARSRCSTASGWSWRARWPRGRALLLLDEIAGGLTEREAHELVETLQRASRRGGVTIVWIEHVVHALLRRRRPAVGASTSGGSWPRASRRR